MGCITINADESLKKDMDSLKGINWSEIMREDLIKKYIFERYLRKRKLSKEDQEFCDSIDWHPVDELPLKGEFVKRIKANSKKSLGKAMTIEEFEKHWDLL